MRRSAGASDAGRAGRRDREQLVDVAEQLVVQRARSAMSLFQPWTDDQQIGDAAERPSRTAVDLRRVVNRARPS